MANINQISLKVCGNPDANGGFQPMVIFNSPSIEIKDNFYTGFDANSYFFTIKIEKNQVVYKLIKNNVSSLGASRQGSLVIGIAIPKGYKLDAGISPYTVLIELKNRFLALCMTCKDPATEKYEFNSNRVSPNILDDIASSYSLVPVQAPYRTMSTGAPIAYVTITEDKIEQLMKDVHYPAFVKYSEIVVANSVGSTSYAPISNLPIPRMVEYSIYDDGVLQPIVVSDPKKLLTVKGKGDPKYYENDTLMFTLEELLKGEKVPNVTLDRANEIINVSSKALVKPITRKINVVFVPEESETYFFTKTNEWGLYYDNQQIRLANDLSFVLTGEEIKILNNIQNFRIRQSRKDKYEAKVSSVSSNEIRISAEKIRRTVGPIGGGGRIGGVVQATNNVNAYEVQLTMKQLYNSRGYYKVELFNVDKVLQSTKVSFNGADTAQIFIPKTWSPSTIYARIKSKDKCWESHNPLGRDVNGIIELKDGDFNQKSVGFFIKHSRGIVISILILLSLIAGAAIGAYVAKNYFGTSTDNNEHAKCNICNVEFMTKEDLDNHMSLEHSDNGGTAVDTNNERTLTCLDCGNGPFNQAELDAHKLKCPKKVKCDKCDERFASESELKTHKETYHKATVASSFKCDKCDHEFTSAKSLRAHKNKDHGPKVCNYCGNTFDDQTALKTHMQAKHHFECTECGPNVYFATQAELTKHKGGKRRDGELHSTR